MSESFKKYISGIESIFDRGTFAKYAKNRRTELKLSQKQLAEKSGLQVNTIRQIEAAAVDSGIMTCLAIASALEFHLPKPVIDQEVRKFAEHLVTKPQLAAKEFDALFFERAKHWELKGVELPKNLLWLAGLSGRKDFLFSITCKLASPPASTAHMRWDEILPVELAMFLDKLARSNVREYPDLAKDSELYTQTAPFWKHVMTGRSDNVGASRLATELRRIKCSLDVVKPSGFKNADFEFWMIQSFINQFEMKRMIRSLCLRHGTVCSEDNWVYLASFMRLFNVSRGLRRQKKMVQDGLEELPSAPKK